MISRQKVVPSQSFIQQLHGLFGSTVFVDGHMMTADFDFERKLTEADLSNLPKILNDNPGKHVSFRWEYNRGDDYKTSVQAEYDSSSSRPTINMRVSSYGYDSSLLGVLSQTSELANREGIDIKIDYTQRTE